MQTSHSSIFSSFIRMSQVSMVMLYSSEIKKYFVYIGVKMIHMQKDILKLLDKKQSNYEFPAFDNEYMDISQVKFSLFFKDTKDWLMVFQLVGVGSLGVCNDIQVYGDRITHSMGDDCILQLNDGNYELFNDEGEFMPNIYNGSLKFVSSILNMNLQKRII